MYRPTERADASRGGMVPPGLERLMRGGRCERCHGGPVAAVRGDGRAAGSALRAGCARTLAPRLTTSRPDPVRARHARLRAELDVLAVEV